MTKKPLREFQLDITKVNDIEDIKKVLDLMQLRLKTDHPLYEEFKNMFTTEVVPVGYARLTEEISEEEIAKMTYEEMQQKINEIFENDEK